MLVAQGAEKLGPHIKNKDAIIALCKEHLGTEWPPQSSTNNPFFTERMPPTAKNPHPHPNGPIPCPHKVMRRYLRSDGKVKLKSGAMGESEASWHDNVKKFIQKHDKLLPKPEPRRSRLALPPLGSSAALPLLGPSGAASQTSSLVVS